MKKIFKSFMVLMIICFVVGFGFRIVIGYSLIVPAFKGTGITLVDFFKEEWEPEKLEKLEENLMERSDILSNKYSASIAKTINAIFFPGKDIPIKEIKDEKTKKFYTVDEVLEMNEKEAQKGIEEGLKYLEEAEKEYDAIRKEALSTNNN